MSSVLTYGSCGPHDHTSMWWAYLASLMLRVYLMFKTPLWRFKKVANF